MRSRFVNPKRKQIRLRPAQLAMAGLAALIAAGDHAGATDRRGERFVESIEQRSAGEPIMAIVSLHSQRITVAASAADQAALMLLRKDSTWPRIVSDCLDNSPDAWRT